MVEKITGDIHTQAKKKQNQNKTNIQNWLLNPGESASSVMLPCATAASPVTSSCSVAVYVGDGDTRRGWGRVHRSVPMKKRSLRLITHLHFGIAPGRTAGFDKMCSRLPDTEKGTPIPQQRHPVSSVTPWGPVTSFKVTQCQGFKTFR